MGGGRGGGDKGAGGGEAYPLSTPSNIGGQWEKADSFLDILVKKNLQTIN